MAIELGYRSAWTGKPEWPRRGLSSWPSGKPGVLEHRLRDMSLRFK